MEYGQDVGGALRVPLAALEHGPGHGHQAAQARRQPVGLCQRLQRRVRPEKT